MANLPDRNGTITASQILSYLQKNNLTNEVFAEILADLKNKQGFKSVRKMVEDLIHSHEGQLYSPTTEKTCRAAILNEICTVAFTIDTILPNVLRMKFQNQFPKLVNELLEELKAEKKIKSFVPYLPGAVSIASTSTQSAAQETPTSAKTIAPKTLSSAKIVAPKTLSSAKIVAPKTSTSTQCAVPPKATHVRPNLPQSAVPPKESASFSSGVATSTLKTNRGRGRPKKNFYTALPIVSKPVAVSSEKEDFDTSKENISVSSVHTSELSSFDDAISVSSNDGKKKISIKEIQQMNQSEKISSWLAQHASSTPKSCSKGTKRKHGSSQTKDMQGAKKRNSFSSETKVSSSDESNYAGSSKGFNLSPKVLPQRKRKPNSKYVSESIVCPIAPRQQKKMDVNKLKYADESSQMRKQMVKNTLPEIEELNSIPGTPQKDPPKSPRVSFEGSTADNRNSLPAASKIFKPFTSVMPLTSRKTAPKTLFSTQHLK